MFFYLKVEGVYTLWVLAQHPPCCLSRHMEGIQTQQPLPSPSEQDQGHPGSQTEQQLTQQQIQQLQQHLPQGTAEDAARVLAQMDQSLLDQVSYGACLGEESH